MEATAPPRRSRRPLLNPAAYGICLMLMNAALVVAVLAMGYLLWGLLGGGLQGASALSHPDQLRVQDNVAAAGNVFLYTLGGAALFAALLFVQEEIAGYTIVLIAGLIGVGVPFLYTQLAGENALSGNAAIALALQAFPLAMRVPLVIGGLLIGWDIVHRLLRTGTARERSVDRETLRYGREARPEKKPVRLSPLGKCWEGPYCREFVRLYCPIFHARKACWKVRRGCYCDEDIVSNAASKIAGTHLTMANESTGGGLRITSADEDKLDMRALNTPDVDIAPESTVAAYNFSTATSPGAAPRKPELNAAQKRERCRQCIIYNEHQREKYRVFVPVVIVGTLALCVLFAPLMQNFLNNGLGTIDQLFSRLTFAADAPGNKTLPIFHRPSETIQWVFVAVFSVMILSKMLQALEWAVFKLKI